MDIGKTIKENRLKLGLTQKELASLLDITGSVISSLEANARKPSGQTILLLSSIFDIDPKELGGEHLTHKGNLMDVLDINFNKTGETIVVPFKWCLSNENDNAKHFAIIQNDASMSPLIKEGDVLIIEKQFAILDSGFYLLKVGNDNVVRSVKRNPDNSITVVSNKLGDCDVAIYSLEEQLKIPITILGKVIESRHKF